MKITPRKNDYGHMVADCPFCDDWVYIRESTKVSPDPLRDLKRHITNQAKNEAFEWALSDGTNGANHHLEYVREHTSMQPVKPAAMKRRYDNDLTV